MMTSKEYIEAVVPENVEHFYLTREEMVTTLKDCWAIAQRSAMEEFKPEEE